MEEREKESRDGEEGKDFAFERPWGHKKMTPRKGEGAGLFRKGTPRFSIGGKKRWKKGEGGGE